MRFIPRTYPQRFAAAFVGECRYTSLPDIKSADMPNFFLSLVQFGVFAAVLAGASLGSLAPLIEGRRAFDQRQLFQRNVSLNTPHD